MARYYYGGAFDPLTLAHEFIIRNLIASFGPSDELIIGVSELPHLKTPFWRLNFRTVAVMEWVKGLPESVSCYIREVVQQTVPTYRFLKGKDVDVLVMGEDELISLKRGEWADSEALMREYTFHTVQRADGGISSTKVRKDYRELGEAVAVKGMSMHAAALYNMAPGIGATPDVRKHAHGCVQWIRRFVRGTGMEKAVIGISGGKDSSICAALCAEALGPDNVIGVCMPKLGQQPGVYEDLLFEHTGIHRLDIPVGQVDLYMREAIEKACGHSEQAGINLPPRLRMAALYAVAQSSGALVCCTDNWSEWMLGYSTLWGDGAGDFAPLLGMPVSLVLELGDELGLPYGLVHMTPSDGLCGKTDEEALGFSYSALETWFARSGNMSKMVRCCPMRCLAGKCVDDDTAQRIEARVTRTAFKRANQVIPKYTGED